MGGVVRSDLVVGVDMSLSARERLFQSVGATVVTLYENTTSCWTKMEEEMNEGRLWIMDRYFSV